MGVHPSAVVEPGAKIAESASVGPFCVIGPDVIIAEQCRIHAHVTISGRTMIGRNVEVFPFAALGEAAQIRGKDSFAGALEIGENCVLREHVTLHCGSEEGVGTTRVGSNCMLMVGAHIGHDSQLGRSCVFANRTTLGGHVRVGEGVWMGGHSAAHQRCEIGQGAFIGGGSKLVGDVIPFGMTLGNQAKLTGLNLRGLKRQGVAQADIHTLRAAYRILADLKQPLTERIGDIDRSFGSNTYVQDILVFLRKDRARPLCVPRGHMRPQ